MYLCNHENNVLSWLSPQWVCGNLYTWTHHVQLHIAGPINQRVLNKLSKENNISIHKWSTTHSAEISQKQDLRNIYAIMKTMCPPGYHHNGFVSIHALEDMMYAYTLFWWLYICCTHLSFVRLEQFVCRGSLISTYLRKFNKNNIRKNINKKMKTLHS